MYIILLSWYTTVADIFIMPNDDIRIRFDAIIPFSLIHCMVADLPTSGILMHEDVTSHILSHEAACHYVSREEDSEVLPQIGCRACKTNCLLKVSDAWNIPNLHQWIIRFIRIGAICLNADLSTDRVWTLLIILILIPLDLVIQVCI